MRQYFFFVLLLALGNVSSAYAQHIQCEPVLVPTVENVLTDFKLIQSYLRVHAASEYDRLQKMDQSARGAEASYEFFGAEYRDSKSREEFQEKVRKRLEQEQFQMNVEDSRAYYRKGVTDAQVQGWKECIVQTAKGGAVLLIPRHVTPLRVAPGGQVDVASSGFTLMVSWLPQRGVGSASLNLKADGGTVDGKRALRVPLTGPTDTSFIVKPTNDSRLVRITANIKGASDAALVSLEPASIVDKPGPYCAGDVKKWQDAWQKDGRRYDLPREFRPLGYLKVAPRWMES